MSTWEDPNISLKCCIHCGRTELSVFAYGTMDDVVLTPTNGPCPSPTGHEFRVLADVNIPLRVKDEPFAANVFHDIKIAVEGALSDLEECGDYDEDDSDV